ncbi:MAG: GGDEF domain-containing protein [Eubacteriales bacterium]|nr:GGDEF domain-containing protein [Eubacteriales bacterium]
MNEKTLNRRLRKGIVICTIVGLLILALGIGTLKVMERSLNELVGEQMKGESNEYKRRILRQVEKDFQTLQTLAAFFAHNADPGSEDFVNVLYEANLQNDFTTMGFWGLDGLGDMAHLVLGTKRGVDYHTLNESVRDTIQAAYEGEPGISRLFDSKVSDGRLFVYCVPVYNGNRELMGVLAASNDVDIFGEMLEESGTLRGSGAMLLVSSNGKVLITPKETEKAKRLENIFVEPFFDQENLEDLQEAVAGEKSFKGVLCYGGRSFYTYLEPVGLNDWYVMCVNDHRASNRIVYQMLKVLAVAVALVFAVVIILLLYIVHQIKSSNGMLIGLAYSDILTGADNLLRFKQRLNLARQQGRGFCVAGLNIYQFKFVNEIFGTNVGNRLLRDLCGRIKSMLREDEFFCRESGDQFYVFLWETDMEVIRNRLGAVMEDVFQRPVVGEKDYKIQMYSGAFLWNGRESLSNEMMLTRCRFAMEYCKRLSANHVHFYDAELHKNEEMENYVESHMHQALEKGEFRLFLQPKLRLEDGSLGGAEALVRWITEEGEMIFPNVFIPQFEKNGFCVTLDMYMVEQVCRQLRDWMDRGIEPIPISVNQTKLLFFDSGYLEKLQALLEKYRVSAEMITLEILEGLALDRAEEINAKLHRLRSMGFRISMDDFGTGYASFNTLGNLEIDELKLDRSFLMEASRARGDRFRTIMEHIVHLSKSLHISTVAEGVETQEDEDLIRSLGCDLGQGYLYSRPIPAEEFDAAYMEEVKA